MNHAAHHLCINSARYTLANTKRRINNKLDTRAHTGIIYSCVVCWPKTGAWNELQTKNNTRKHTTKRHHTYFWTSNWSKWLQGLICPMVTRQNHLVSVQKEGLYGCNRVESLWRERESLRTTGEHIQIKRAGLSTSHPDRRSKERGLKRSSGPSSKYPVFTGHSVHHRIKKIVWSTGHYCTQTQSKPMSPCPAVT